MYTVKQFFFKFFLKILILITDNDHMHAWLFNKFNDVLNRVHLLDKTNITNILNKRTLKMLGIQKQNKSQKIYFQVVHLKNF